jgi:uncharacterized protein YndB with AHSA1/START domain
MTTKVEKSVVVEVPVRTAYNQWTQFEEFPRFMGGVEKVTQISNERLEWFAEIGGVRRQWTAQILEQVPDRKVAWAATEGAVNAGAVTFEDLGGRTSVHLSLEFEPEGVLEKLADTLRIIERQAEADLERFKTFIESQGGETGAWRGSINEGSGVGTPGTDQARAARNDDDLDRPGASGAAVAAGTAAVIGSGAATTGTPYLDEAGGSRSDLTPGTAGTSEPAPGSSSGAPATTTPAPDVPGTVTGIGDTIPNDGP